MSLTLKPASDDILSLSGDIRDEIDAYDADMTIILSNGSSAKLLWGDEGFYWTDVKGLMEVPAASEEHWPTLHTDAKIDWVRYEGLEDYLVSLSDEAASKLDPLISEADEIFKDDVASSVIQWLFVTGRLNLSVATSAERASA